MRPVQQEEAMLRMQRQAGLSLLCWPLADRDGKVRRGAELQSFLEFRAAEAVQIGYKRVAQQYGAATRA